MRLVHTSDWHLGRSFHGVGLFEAQARYLDHLVDLVRSESIDAVLVAGDVYDRALPAPETVELLSQTLIRLVDAGAKVVVSSGNHDSAVRLGFASPLLDRAGVHLRTSVSEITRPVMLGDVAIHAIPYLEPTMTAESLSTSERTHAGVLRAAMSRVRESFGRCAHDVVMAHAFVSGGVGSESERDISVGGVCAVAPETFSGASYVALGHLHGPQQVAEGVRYSGSPVAMSFGEARHRKVSAIVTLSPGHAPAVELVAAPVERPLAILRGTLDELLHDPSLVGAESAWCQVTVTDEVRPIGTMDRLRHRFPHTLELRFDPPPGAHDLTTYRSRVTARSDLEVCCDFLAHVRGGHGPTDAEHELLRTALDQSRADRRRREADGVASTREGAA